MLPSEFDEKATTQQDPHAGVPSNPARNPGSWCSVVEARNSSSAMLCTLHRLTLCSITIPTRGHGCDCWRCPSEFAKNKMETSMGSMKTSRATSIHSHGMYTLRVHSAFSYGNTSAMARATKCTVVITLCANFHSSQYFLALAMKWCMPLRSTQVMVSPTLGVLSCILL